MATMACRDEIFAAHPNGSRSTRQAHYRPGYSKNQLCYSNENSSARPCATSGPSSTTTSSTRSSVMPPDGYTAMCQCKLCEGKDSPQSRRPWPIVRLRVGFLNRLPRRLARRTGQEGAQLRLRRLHAAAAEDRQAGAERARLDRGRPQPVSNKPGKQEECRKPARELGGEDR